uniref:Uncharacterized protein n=1 Tax=Arundo donax TaxID=35708 RepID=A0A0A9H8G6_ARUDO
MEATGSRLGTAALAIPPRSRTHGGGDWRENREKG